MRQLTETQRIRDYKPVYFLLLLATTLPAVIVATELARAENTGLGEWPGIIAALSVLAISLLVILPLKTEVKLTHDALYYKANPWARKLRKMHLHELREYYLANHMWHHGLGYKTTLHTGFVYVLKPGKVLVVKTMAGRTYRFGINRPGLVQKFINDHWTEKKESYG
ncbi:MAG: hypothetical protein U5L96_22315 [Owenweeksia sp.]|nr:hypothetical protein [Owenweeksia sp.]